MIGENFITQETDDPVLQLRGPFVFLPGKGFGIRQSVASVRIQLHLPYQIDGTALDNAMEEFLPDQPIHLPQANDHASLILFRILAWQAAIQRNANLPVFGLGHSFNLNSTERLLIMPYFCTPASQTVMAWILAAIRFFVFPPSKQTHSLEDVRRLYAELRAELRKHALPGTNVFHFLEAAHTRKLEINHIASDVISFGVGCNSRWLDSTITDSTPSMAIKNARNKFACARILDLHGLPTPIHGIPANADQAVSIAEQIGYPVVVKPYDLDGGRGVYAGLPHDEAVREAYACASAESSNLLVEKHIVGSDFRLTVLHGEVIKVMKRRPGGVTGDGSRTIAELMKEEQRKPDHQAALRRTGHMRISLDAEAMELLQENGLTQDSVPERGRFVVLRRKSNISTGGTYTIIPVTHIHLDNLRLAVSAASVIGLDIAGVDLIITDITKSWREVGGAICEVNGKPQIGHRDTPEIYDLILSRLLKNHGELNVHLIISDTHKPPSSAFIEEMTAKGYNAIVHGNAATTVEGGVIGPFQNSFYAAKAILSDRRTTGAILFMCLDDIISHGLPASWFTSIRVVLPTGCPPDTVNTIMKMIHEHTNEAISVTATTNAASQEQTGATAAE
ncbi:hypothetical protein [Caenibius sp. WL]|uniref:ATP-binding protein n=1 Tax=Caenibius sp. WL TaxID=2872646 RepID=UPI001C994803|nr:hypothetical protein [Caenibius sp. WL]QZP08859.1 hypothetical protein K5X80_03480 [Caenibius sp. WL]